MRYYDIDDLCSFLSTGSLSASKIALSNIGGLGTYFWCSIGNTLTATKLTSSLLTSLSDQGLGCINA